MKPYEKTRRSFLACFDGRLGFYSLLHQLSEDL